MSVPTHTRAHAHRRTCSNPGSQNWSWNFMVFIFCGPMANSAGAVLGPWWAFLFFKVRQMELLTAMSNSPHEGGSFMMRKFLNSWVRRSRPHGRSHAHTRPCQPTHMPKHLCPSSLLLHVSPGRKCRAEEPIPFSLLLLYR